MTSEVIDYIKMIDLPLGHYTSIDVGHVFPFCNETAITAIIIKRMLFISAVVFLLICVIVCCDYIDKLLCCCLVTTWPSL